MTRIDRKRLPHGPRGLDGRRERAGHTFIEICIVMIVMSVAVMIFASTVTAGSQQRAINRERSLAAAGAMSALERMRNEPHDRIWALFNADPSDDPGGAGTAPGRNFAVRGLNVPPGDPDGFVGEIHFPDQLYGAGGGGSGGDSPPGTGGGGGEPLGGGGGLGFGGPPPQLVSGGGGVSGGGSLSLGDFGNKSTTWSSETSGSYAGGGGWQLREDLDLPELGLPRDLNGDSMVDALDHSDDYVVLPVRVVVRWTGRAGITELETTTIFAEFRKE